MRNYFVYKFENIEQTLLYVGSTIELRRRINYQHLPLKCKGNLDKKCIEETHKIYFHECESKSDMEIKEKFLINTLNPKYPKYHNNGAEFSFNIPIKWKEYDFKKTESGKEKKNKNVKVFTLNLKETPYNKLINIFQEYKLVKVKYSLTLTQFLEISILYYADFLQKNNSYSEAPESFIKDVIMRPGRRPFREKTKEVTISSNIWLDEKIYSNFLNVTYTHSVKYDIVNVNNYSLSFMSSKLIDFIEHNKKFFFQH